MVSVNAEQLLTEGTGHDHITSTVDCHTARADVTDIRQELNKFFWITNCFKLQKGVIPLRQRLIQGLVRSREELNHLSILIGDKTTSRAHHRHLLSATRTTDHKYFLIPTDFPGC